MGDEDWAAIVAVQAASALMGGCISGGITTPLDVVKTQLQVRHLSLFVECCMNQAPLQKVAIDKSYIVPTRSSIGYWLQLSTAQR